MTGVTQQEATARRSSPASPDDRQAAMPSGAPVPIRFDASCCEYFRVWAVCQFLSIFTLGLYGPWARLRKSRFLARHLWLGSQHFDVAFKPKVLLRGRILAQSLLSAGALLALFWPVLNAPLLLIAFAPLPWLLSRSVAFRWRTVSYAGHTFKFESDGGRIRYSIWLVGLLTILAVNPGSVFGLVKNVDHQLVLQAVAQLLLIVVWPYATSSLAHHMYSRARWAGLQFDLATTPGKIYRHMWRRAFLATIGILLVVAALLYLANLAKNRGYADYGSLLQALSWLLTMVAAVAFARIRRLNFVLNRLTIGGNLKFHSRLRPGRACFYAMFYSLVGVLTMGLAVPWATVRYIRWQLSQISAHCENEFEALLTVHASSPYAQGAVADALAEAFDIEIGL